MNTHEQKKNRMMMDHDRFSVRKMVFPVAGVVMLSAAVLVSVSLGAAGLTSGQVIEAILGRMLPFLHIEVLPLADAVVWTLRLPRTVTGIVAGAGLAVAGAAMQGILRNPLVSPFTIGISSGAGFGAALAFVIGVGVVGAGKYMVIGNAFFFSLLAAVMVYGLARLRGTSPETLILAGIALMYLFSAATSMLQYVATEEKLQGVVFWLFGSLGAASWTDIGVISLVFFTCLPFLIRLSWDLNTLSAGDEVALSIGINAAKVRFIVMMLASLITATIICFTGIIGFVCLVAPHITRMLIGSDHRYLIPFAAIVGALLLLVADTIGRNILAPAEVPVGIITAFIGVPMFIYLLLSRRRSYFQ